LRGAGRLLYPILFAVSLVFGIAAMGAGQYQARDLAIVSAMVALATALTLVLVLAVTRLVDRSDRALPLGAALTMVLVAWFFYYEPAQRAAQEIAWRLSRDPVLVPLGLLATVGLLVWLFRQPRDRLVAVNAFMTRFGVLLLLFVVVQLAMSGGPALRARRSVLVRQLSEPLRVSSAVPAVRNQPKRDIYLVVLDAHANSRVAREEMNDHDTSFEDSLRTLGFTIPRAMHSNYVETILSVPSLLNSSHMTQLAQDAGVTTTSFALPRYLVENNRTARFLRSRGYKYVLFPSMWWMQSQHSPIADVEFNPRPAPTIENELRRTELRQAVVSSTLLRFRRWNALNPSHEFRTMEGLKRVPADPAPTFAFAHVLLPHPPYYLDASCHPVAHPITSDQEDGSPAQRAAALAQTRCVDRMVLDLVTTLLRDSPVPPVIVVVGDHGSRFSAPKFAKHPDSLPTEFMRERFGAFGAFYLPAGGDSAFTGSVSLVNVMGNVLRYYFGVELASSPDDMYVSGDFLYRFYQVDSTGYLGR
jgi:hypothetical protein